MSLLNNNSKKGKKGNKAATGAAGKFNAPKPGTKGAGVAKRPIKTGGTRGS